MAANTATKLEIEDAIDWNCECFRRSNGTRFTEQAIVRPAIKPKRERSARGMIAIGTARRRAADYLFQSNLNIEVVAPLLAHVLGGLSIPHPLFGHSADQ